jgi:hypothetical protein
MCCDALAANEEECNLLRLVVLWQCCVSHAYRAAPGAGSAGGGDSAAAGQGGLSSEQAMAVAQPVLQVSCNSRC